MKYLMVLQHGAMDECLYKDLLDLENVREFKISAPDCGKFLYYLRRIHTSTFATRFFDPPLKTVWYKKGLIKTIDEDTCVIFQMSAMIHVGMETLNSIKKERPTAKTVLLLVDSIDAHSYSMRYAKRFIFEFDWDLILSFDEEDCRKYGFTYMGVSYYSKQDIKLGGKINSDLYYIGAAKPGDSRVKLLNDIYLKCNKENVNCEFTLVSLTRQDTVSGIRQLDKGIPYIEVLENMTHANCILEIVQEGQNNQTARYMEAICYNKKLLTNNPSVKSLPYYDERFIKLFKTIDDIDVTWIKKIETVDYNYQGEFSPKKILLLINKAFGFN